METKDKHEVASGFGVMLPCTQEQFQEFISKLLGRPQTIRRMKSCVFDLTRTDVENTYHLIQQRVAQNNGTLIEFSSRLGYSDHSSIELKSLEEFQAYREIRPLIATSLKLTWTYLIRFPQSQVPEKQTIELGFVTGRSPMISRTRGFVIGEVDSYRTDSMICFEIANTSRTWGADMESLLSGHIDTLSRDEHGIRAFIVKYSGWIGLFAALLFMVMSVIGAVFAADEIAKMQVRRMGNHATEIAKTIPELSEQLAHLTAITASGVWARLNFLQGVYFICSVILAIILGIWVGSTADNRPPSFLQLTDKSITDREKVLQERKNGWMQLTISWIVTLIGGGANRVIFYYASKWWLG